MVTGTEPINVKDQNIAKVLPYDFGREEYRPSAVVIGAVIGRHQALCSALVKSFSLDQKDLIYSYSQGDHIRKLMKWGKTLV